MNALRVVLSVPFICLVLAAPQTAFAHKFYTSIAHVEYNEQEGKLEVSLRVFADDLERALSVRSGKRVRLDTTKDAEALALAYLRDSFEVRDGKGARVELSWVGWNTENEVVWFYFEAALDSAGARIRNEIFLSLFENQVNTVNIKRGDKLRTHVFKRGDAGFKPLF